MRLVSESFVVVCYRDTRLQTCLLIDAIIIVSHCECLEKRQEFFRINALSLKLT